MEFCCLYLFLYSDSIFWFSLMILKEKNNPKKILMDRVLDVNHKQENMPSAQWKGMSSVSLSVWFSSYYPVCAGLLRPFTNASCRSEWP